MIGEHDEHAGDRRIGHDLRWIARSLTLDSSGCDFGPLSKQELSGDRDTPGNQLEYNRAEQTGAQGAYEQNRIGVSAHELEFL